MPASRVRRIALLVVPVSLLVLVGGLAAAAPTSAPRKIVTCYATRGAAKGQLRFLASGTRCPAGTRRLAWYQQGPVGPTGAAGATGATGSPGVAGPQGAPGPSEAFNQGLAPGAAPTPVAPGAYTFEATVQGSNTTGIAVDLSCTLSLGPGVPGNTATTTLAAGAKGQVVLHQIHTFDAEGAVGVTCTGPFVNGLLVGVRVGLTREI